MRVNVARRKGGDGVSESCKSCRFWDKLPHTERAYGQGFCRRRAPLPVLASQESKPEALWMITADCDWCGEYQPKTKAKAKTATVIDDGQHHVK